MLDGMKFSGTVVFMKVIIQKRLEGYGFCNQIFNVKLRSLRSGFYILEDFEYLGQSPEGHLPILHKGYFDAHLHHIAIGLSDHELDLKSISSLPHLWEAIGRYRSQLNAPFMKAYGWDQSKYACSENDLINEFEKNTNFPTPFIMLRICGHAALVNEAFKAFVGRPDLPTWLNDNDLTWVQHHLPKFDEKQMYGAFIKAQKKLLDHGITAISDMSLGEQELHTIEKVARNGDLKLDIEGVYLDSEVFWKKFQTGPMVIKNSVAIGPLDRQARFRLMYWKRYLDGSLGARTAWLSKPYQDGDTFGQTLHADKELIHKAQSALRLGFGLSFHCIGDAALAQALTVGRLLKNEMIEAIEGPRSSDAKINFHRLEHCQVVQDNQLGQLSEQKLWQVFLQPHHRVADQEFVEQRLGQERLYSMAYRAKGFIDKEIPLSLSSDAPIDTYDPNFVIRAALEHPNPRERLNFDEAVWYYTTGSRLASGLDPGVLMKGSTVYLSEPLT